MLDPKDSMSLSNLGVAYRQTNRMAEAEKYFKKALELKNDWAELHYNLATVYRRQNKAQEAIASYEKAVSLSPTLAEAHHDLGILYAQEKRNEDAIKHWNHYLELVAAKSPGEAEIARKRVQELGGKPSR
jgi:Flp pilus assembly protein TadD